MNRQFEIEEIVYLKTDSELSPRMVTGYKVTKHDVTYGLTCGTQVTWHYDFEITRKPQKLNSTEVKGLGHADTQRGK